jgi:hypothetical protein
MSFVEGLPSWTHFLSFHYSDGDAARLENLDSKYRHVAINEKPAIEWRRKVGKAVAELLGWPCEYSRKF